MIISPSKRVMVFIDGGYLKKILKEEFGDRIVDDPLIFFQALNYLISRIQDGFSPYAHPEIVRTYYYDAIVLPSDEKYNEQEKYFKIIQQKLTSFEVKLGRLIRGKETKQKGVDVLLSIDLTVKAFLNHYDLAVIVAGDDDFLDAIKVVKDLTGKKIEGVYSKKNTSERLIESFDYRYPVLPYPLYDKFKIVELDQRS